MKVRNSFVVRCKDKRVNWKKKIEDRKFFTALAKRFWLTSKSCPWFNIVDLMYSLLRESTWKWSLFNKVEGNDQIITGFYVKLSINLLLR